MRLKVAKIEILTASDIAFALMREAGITRNIDGEYNPPPIDSKQSARVAALKTLTDYTGGFDQNTQKHEVTGYIDKPMSDLYDDDDE